MIRWIPRSFAAVAMACAAMTGCQEPECFNEVSREVLSPDRKMKIVLFSRDCGATTGFNTQATVLAANESLPDSAGDAFIIDHGEASVSWKDNTSVLVVIDRDVGVFKKEVSVRGITFEYRQR